jgi:DNA modification methylase
MVNDITAWTVAVNKIVCGDCFDIVNLLPDKSVDVCVTSPPYWQQRDYGYASQIGLENSVEEYLDKIVNFFDSVKRVLKDDGTLWVNIGDCFNENTGGYFGKDNCAIGKNRIKTKKYQKQYPRRSLLMIPYRFAISMIDKKQWFCRNHIIWYKKVVQPTTAKNRFTIDHEPIFMFSKKQKYYFDKEKVKFIDSNNIYEQPRERRSVWSVSTEHTGKVDHIAPYPTDLIGTIIDATCRKDALVLDPFMGSATTALVAKNKGLSFFGGDGNLNTCLKAESRIGSAKT